MISPSLPEPLCDVLAQFRALADQAHPKDCIWLARGTKVCFGAEPAHRSECADGFFFSTDADKARYFERHPSDETLAALLGYVEPKWRISGYPIVARAVDPDGCVITEMVCSGHRVGEAVDRLRHHGRIELRALGEVLSRRLRLCALENR
jgi:hypothetical protein